MFKLPEVHLPLMKQERVTGMATWQIEEGVKLRICTNRASSTAFLAHGGSALEPNSKKLYATARNNEMFLARNGIELGGDAVFHGPEKMVQAITDMGQHTVIAIDAVRKLSQDGMRPTDYSKSVLLSLRELKRQGRDVEWAIGDSLGALAILEATTEMVEKGEDGIPKKLILINAPLGGFAKMTLSCARTVGGGNGMMDLYPDSQYLIDLRTRLRKADKKLPMMVTIRGEVGQSYVGFALGGVPISRVKNLGDFETGGDGVVDPEGARLHYKGEPIVSKVAQVTIGGCFHNLTRKQAAGVVGEIVKSGTVNGVIMEPGAIAEVPDSGWLKKNEGNCIVAFGALQMILRATNKQ